MHFYSVASPIVQLGSATQGLYKLPDLEFNVDLNDTSWRFTPKARLTIWKLGATNLEQMRAFILRLLATQLLRAGETEINLQGEGFRITKQDSTYNVELLEE